MSYRTDRRPALTAYVMACEDLRKRILEYWAAWDGRGNYSEDEAQDLVDEAFRKLQQHHQQFMPELPPPPPSGGPAEG